MPRVAGLAGNVLFWANALFFGLRDLFFPPGKKLREAGIERADPLVVPMTRPFSGR